MQNSNRLLHLDILKVIALILMPCIHVFGIMTSFDLVSSNFNVDSIEIQMGLIYLITPTIFMFAMGCGLYLSRNNTPDKLAIRGLKLLLYGFILNICRGQLFYLIIGIFKSLDYITEGWYWLWGSDILYFAGLFFLLYALFKKLNLKDSYILIISIIMFIISNFILSINIDNYTLSLIIGNIIYVDIDSYFPILTWTIIPIIGYFFQKYYDLCNNKNKYVINYIIFGLIILILTLLITKLTNTLDSRYFLWGEKDFFIDFPTFLITLSINIIYIGIIYFISKFIKNKIVINLINKVSININRIYIIHWILLMYLGLLWIFFIKYRLHYTIEIYILGIVAFIVSCIIAFKLPKRK